MRAPEVYLGHACAGPCQVWALAAMLLCWIKRSILGDSDCPHPVFSRAWSTAKLKRLFPDWELLPRRAVDKDVLQGARYMSLLMNPPMQTTLPIHEELQKVEMPQDLRDALELILVIDPGKPSMPTILPLREEMQNMEMPQQLRDLLSFMLVTNPDKRPSASVVLASNEFRAFEKVVGA